MGVTGLWTVVQPCARPIKIESLNKKRLAVDASIWIYQFLKAVRDKEGNALRNSHVVGFFRRICKLLFFGIKPIFVFDGGAPALKRQTINARKRRREGRREDALRTAGKLLAVQMQRRAEEEVKKRREDVHRPRHQTEEEVLPENLVYVEELHMTPQERQRHRAFKKKDAYHLPELEVSLAEMGAPNDPRIMSMEELEEYARQFERGEDINLYDFSKIDFDGPFFQSLPAVDQYNILNAARLRSRLRMGYSKDQLDYMFPDRMAFSRFQIERVRERNELTQRLMHLSGTAPDPLLGESGVGRIAGEKNREYVLVRSEKIEGGWVLAVVDKEEGKQTKPIDVDRLDQRAVESDVDDDWEDDDEFEDIPINGLNRLPKQVPISSTINDVTKDLERRRQAIYDSRQQDAQADMSQNKRVSDSLFVGQNEARDNEWEDIIQPDVDHLFEEGDQGPIEDVDGDLQRAIAMSLQTEQPQTEFDDDDDYQNIFQQAKVEEAPSFPKGSGLAIARIANIRSSKAIGYSMSDSESDGGIDLQVALRESRKTKHKLSRLPEVLGSKPVPSIPTPQPTMASNSKQNPFGGPLPFEKLDLGNFMSAKRKRTEPEDTEGGFMKEGEDEIPDKAPTPPPWFSRDLEDAIQARKKMDDEKQTAQDVIGEESFIQDEPRYPRHTLDEVIDVDALESPTEEPIVINSSDEGSKSMERAVAKNDEVLVDNITNTIPAGSHPLQSHTIRNSPPQPLDSSSEKRPIDEQFEWEPSDHEQADGRRAIVTEGAEPAQPTLHTAVSKSPSPEFEDVPRAGGQSTKDARIPLKAGAGHQVEILVSELTDHDTVAEIPDNLSEEDDILFSDPEEEDLLISLSKEAEEHARFASSLSNKPVGEAFSVADYENDLKQLRDQQRKDRRDADEVTQNMIAECQQLLTLFGLPYITAPMEAEAQCAELVSLGLVDGIVTDDSDIFLFGGTRVYKNMFNAAKFVECYLAPDLEAEFGLTRPKLIAIAQLLGSDYTTGIPGIGPVTAVELIGEFGTLEAFAEWWRSIQSGARELNEDRPIPFRRKFRKSHGTKLFLPPSFPDQRVEQAYLEPEVDKNDQAFVWGVPDLNALRKFLMSTVGWSQERTDEILVPVIRDMNRRETEGTQSNITAFFEGTVGAGAFAPRRRQQGKSKRLENALGRIAAQSGRRNNAKLYSKDDDDAEDGAETDGEQDAQSSSKRRKRLQRGALSNSSSDFEAEGDDGYPRKRAKSSRRGRKRK